MHEYPWAMKRLASRTVSLFRDTNDMLFSYGEVSKTIYMLLNGWVTLSIGHIFEDANADMDKLKTEMRTAAGGASGGHHFHLSPLMNPVPIQVRRRIITNTFDREAEDLAMRFHSCLVGPGWGEIKR